MKAYIEERVLGIAAYLLETGATVRAAAGKFKISKSTVHKDVTERLVELNLRWQSRCAGCCKKIWRKGISGAGKRRASAIAGRVAAGEGLCWLFAGGRENNKKAAIKAAFL